jgi:hypothetical protein
MICAAHTRAQGDKNGNEKLDRPGQPPARPRALGLCAATAPMPVITRVAADGAPAAEGHLRLEGQREQPLRPVAQHLGQ